MAEQNFNINDELIAKYLAGECSAQEELQVEGWINASAQNSHAFSQMKTLWEQTGKIVPTEEADVNVDLAWSRFKNKIETPSEDNPKAKTRNLFFYASRIAAVLIVGFIFYFLVKNLRQTDSRLNKISAAQETKTDTLTDGSVISLNVHSQITIPKNFSKGDRTVSLQGEAFFNVAHDTSRPFIIKTNGVTVTVLGTEFYVSAYDSIDIIKVGVQEGRVLVENENRSFTLNKGESLTIDKSSKEAVTDSYEPNEIYWKSETLIFQNDPLAEVFQTLEKIYAVEIEIENENILDCRLTAKFYQEDVERIFEIIGDNFQLTTQNENNHFTISGSGCK